MPAPRQISQRSRQSQNKSIAARTVGFRQVFGHVSHLVDGLSRTKHWALGAVIAALCSFAYAKVPGVPHGGGSGGGYSHAAAGHAMRGDARNGGHYYGATDARPARNNVADRNARLPHGGANFAAAATPTALAVTTPACIVLPGRPDIRATAAAACSTPAPSRRSAPSRAQCRVRRPTRRFAPVRFAPMSPATTKSAVPRAPCSARGTTRVSGRFARTVTTGNG